MNKSFAFHLKIFAAVFLFVSFSVGFNRAIYAATLTNRSVRVGTSVPSANTSHLFNFDIPGSSTMGSIEFEYCENDPLIGTPCTPPAGFDASGGSLDSQSGETGFSTVYHPNSTANKVIISRVPAATTPGPAEYLLHALVNPSGEAESYYVRISTYASTDGTGPRTDSGGVVFSTSGRLAVNAFVPPYLTFCSGITVTINCTSASGFNTGFGVLSSKSPGKATSQFAAHTNDPEGYTVSASGSTMTSGNNTITRMSSVSPSSPGTKQFGLNLVKNPALNYGQNVIGSGSAVPRSDYNNQNQFKFKSSEIIASSVNSTASNVFTVSYLVNIAGNQPPGIYSTTLTYIAVATF